MDAGVMEVDFKKLVRWIRDVSNIKAPPPADNGPFSCCLYSFLRKLV